MINFTNKVDCGIDLSHHNPQLDFTKLTDIWFCINKAFQISKDSQFDIRTKLLQNTDILYGAYCFLDGSIDPTTQANLFLAAVKPYLPQCKLFVDFERNLPGQQSASEAQCETFINYIFNITKRWPVVYTGLYTLKYPSKTLGQCDLWLAKYGPPPKFMPPGFAEAKLKLWQHTDGHVGYDVQPLTLTNGSQYHCDRSYWFGTRDELVAWWSK